MSIQASGVKISRIIFFQNGITQWLEQGKVSHDSSHVIPFDSDSCVDLAEMREIADSIHSKKIIMGIFDEGCMGMYNAIIPDELLMAMGIFKERLSQSALYYATRQVSDEEARNVF